MLASRTTFFLRGALYVALLIVAGIGLLVRGRGPILLKEKEPNEKLADVFES